MQNGFTHDQKVSGYRLLALSYLFARKMQQADSAILLLLRHNPQYEIRADDPAELKKTIQKFSVHPRFGFTIGGGVYQPSLKVTEVYNVRNIREIAFNNLALNFYNHH